jgi:hypothetical protein
MSCRTDATTLEGSICVCEQCWYLFNDAQVVAADILANNGGPQD